MAVTGKFAADFAAFYDAVQKSEVYLKSFETSGAKVETQLNRVVNSFSGQKIFSEAAIAAEAIKRLGDVTNLTDTEARRINATLTEAIAKYNALGLEAPEDVRKVHTELSKIHPELQKQPDGIKGILNSLSPLAGAFGIAFSATAIIGFGKEVLADADALVKMSDKTGEAIEPLQRLKYTAEQSGNSFEQITGAVTQMQNRLASGDGSAIGALKELGLTFDQLRGKSPGEQFKLIAAEVARIPDPMERTRVAIDLFGKTGAEVMPTILADFKALGDEAPVMSEKAVRAFDSIGDAASRGWTIAKNVVGESVGTAIDAYQRLGAAGTALVTGDFSRIPKILIDIETELPKVEKPITQLAYSMKGLQISTKDYNEIAETLTRRTLADIEKKTTDFKKAQDALFGRDLIQRALEFKDQLGDIGNVTKLTEDKKKELKTAIDAALNAYKALGEEAPPELRKIAVEAGKVVISMEDMDKWAKQMAEKDLGPLAGLLYQLDKTLDPLPKQFDEATESGARFRAEVIEPLPKEIDAAVEALAKLGHATRPFGEFTTQGVATPTGQTFGPGGLSFATDPRVLGYLSAGYTIGEALALAGGGSTNILGPSRRAEGGPVEAGRTYLVGERGAELFTPGASGFISPNGAGGNVTININVNAGLGDRHSIAQALSEAAQTLFQRMGQRAPSFA